MLQTLTEEALSYLPQNTFEKSNIAINIWIRGWRKEAKQGQGKRALAGFGQGMLNFARKDEIILTIKSNKKILQKISQ